MGSFDLDVVDRWSDEERALPIAEEDACRVEIDGVVVVDGFVDRRTVAVSPDSRTLSYSGRDKAAVLVDCSANLDQWMFRNVDTLAVAKRLAQPFGIEVSLQPGLRLPAPPKKFVVSPGETAFAAIQRAAQIAGVLVVSDGHGGLTLTRAGAARAAPLVLGENLLTAAAEFDATDRFSRYVVVTQVGGTDEAYGPVTAPRAFATDAGVRRANRVRIIRPDQGVTVESARRRADWDARVSAARAETMTCMVLGWKQPSGALWPVNARVPVRATAVGIEGDMLISSVEHLVNDTGEVTQLRLVRPDAFTPEPKAVVAAASGVWKELAGGAR